MITIETTDVKNERTEVSAVHFSHPTLGAALHPTDNNPAAPLRFLAPADDDAAESDPGHAG
jgi:hypothetical protein